MNLLKDTKLVNILQGNEIVTFGTEIYKVTLFSQCLFSKQVVNGKIKPSPNE